MTLANEKLFTYKLTKQAKSNRFKQVSLEGEADVEPQVVVWRQSRYRCVRHCRVRSRDRRISFHGDVLP